MTPAGLILPDSAVSALGLALVHFLWQGYLIALGLWLVLRLSRPASARYRYAAACGALLLMAAAPVITVSMQQRPADGRTTVHVEPVRPFDPGLAVERTQGADRGGVAVAGATSDSGADERVLARHAWLGSMLPWFVTLWMAGVALLALRLAGGWMYTLRLGRLSARAPVPAWQAMVDRLARTIDLERPVRVLESAAVAVPTVVGCVKPLLLVPAAALSGLSSVQVEALIVHELAHIRRHDYIVNVLQSIVETLLFYHPAVWWVSRRIRIERECCCDDAAVRACGDPLEYARGLAALEERRAAVFAIAATDGSLPDRIRRILAEPSAGRRGAGLIPATLATALLLVVAGALVPAGGRTLDSSVRMQPAPRKQTAPSAEKEQRPEQDQTAPEVSTEDPERALGGIHAARAYIDEELARATIYADGLPDSEGQRLLDETIVELQKHRAMLDRAEAEVVSWMGAAEIERGGQSTAALARERGQSGRMDPERWRHVEEQVEEAIERIAEEMERAAEQWQPTAELLERITADAQRLAEEVTRRVEEEQLSPERLRRIEREVERAAREAAVQLERSQPMREALQAMTEEAVRMAAEASRVAAEIVASEQMKTVIAEAERMSADIARQVQSREWQQVLRDVERAIEEAARSMEEHRHTRRPRSDQKP